MVRIKRHIPIRTCISCGLKRNKNDLIRLILDAQGVVRRDDFGKMHSSRGAYVCPNKSCREKSGKDKRLNRAFKEKSPVTFHIDYSPV